MDCSVQARKKDHHSSLEHYAEMNNSCMAIQETKVLVSAQNRIHLTFHLTLCLTTLTRYASFAIVNNKICRSEDTGLGSLQGKIARKSL